MAISAVDMIILVAYLILTLFIGWYVSKKITGFDDFAVGGRSFGPFVLAATFGATNFSTWSMVGKPGVVYNAGIRVLDCLKCLRLCAGGGGVCAHLPEASLYHHVGDL